MNLLLTAERWRHHARYMLWSNHPAAHVARCSLLRYRQLGEFTLKPFLETQSIFVHVPKTAGVSLSRSLYGSLTGGHIRLAAYQWAFGRSLFDRLFKFAFVRNPWDRLYSAYHFLKRGGYGRRDQAWARLYLQNADDFETFVLDWLNKRTAYAYAHFIPQIDFLRLRNKTIGLDFVGYYEHLEEDSRFVFERLGVRNNLEWHNRSPAAIDNSYRQHYSQQMINAVREIYKEDIETFGYGFDEIDASARAHVRCKQPHWTAACPG